MVYGLWFMVYGLWFMVYGLWFMVYGLWFMVYGLWFMGLGRIVTRSPRQVRVLTTGSLSPMTFIVGCSCPGSSHVVVLQVAFERQILKPVFHLIGFRLWV
jgi:hypothetical protein